ncbi:MAG: flavodoxin reductase [Bacteroidetes bacterium]|nr:flavodoxin reductase [Bacteroidota bacterium]
MGQYLVKVIDAQFITHDVKRFVVEKPDGYVFVPGQAAEIAINVEGWKKKKRPFTFTGLNKWDYLEFLIKIYSERSGVTDMLGGINAGDELILGEPFGAITYHGPGVFIAGGAGITPFVAIFRELQRSKQLAGNLLILSNKTSEDVILGQELSEMLRENFINVYTRENVIGFLDRRIDRNFLIEHIVNFSQHFYLCGPSKFVQDMKDILLKLGAELQSLVIED